MSTRTGWFRRRPADPEPEPAAVEVAGAPGAVEATREIVAQPRPDRPIVADDALADPGVVDEVDAHADSAIAMLRAERDAARQEAAHLREEAARSRFMLKDANGRADEAAHFADQAARAASVAVQRAGAADAERVKLRRALEEQRPTIDVDQLADRLHAVWLSIPPSHGTADPSGPRWRAVAHAAIDTIRGTWPIEVWPLTAREVEQPAPTPRSPGSGAEAAPSAPGDPTATGPLAVSEIAALDAEADRRLGGATGRWPYKTSPGGGVVAEAQEALTAPGASAPGDPTPEPERDPARETLARALARSELEYLRRTWPDFTEPVRDEYRSMADDVIAAGWQPPTGQTKP